MYEAESSTREVPMFTRTLLIIALVVAFGASCFAAPAFAGGRARLRHPPVSKQHVAADRDPYADPAAPYKADRLSSRPDQRILDIPGQTTVLTRQVLDDKNATSLKDAMRSTAGVTVGR
jgi:outer membrane receptor for monomeric catechols